MSNTDLFYIEYSIVSEVIMFIVFALVHIGYFRFKKVKKILRAILVQGVVSGILGLIITASLYNDIQEPIVAINLLNFVLFCTIIFAYGSMGPIMADRSVSVFLLILLDEDKDGKGSANYMADRLGGHFMFDKRFIEHSDVGAIKQDGDTLTVTKKGKKIAKFYLFLINLLNLKKNY